MSKRNPSTGNRWFRLYAEFASDPKVQILSEAMQRRLVMLFCLRCSNDLVTLQDEEIAFQLRISSEELAETKALFLVKGFVDDGWNILNWDKRQFASDSSAARVARHRENKRNAEKLKCNVTVAPPYTETDTENKPTSLRSVGESAHTTAANDGIPVPEDLDPGRTAAMSASSLNLDLETERQKFIAHHQAQGSIRKDIPAWQAQFRKWLLDQHQFNSERERVTQSRMSTSPANQQTTRLTAMSGLYNPPNRDVPAEREIHGETIHAK